MALSSLLSVLLLHTLIISTLICKVVALVVQPALHGLPTQQVPRQQRVDWGGTPHHSSVLPTRGSPQAGVLLHAAPKQLSAGLCAGCSQAAATAAAAIIVVPVG